MLRALGLMVVVYVFLTSASAAVLTVGPGKQYASPSAIPETALQDGDTIEIDAGVYPRDARIWRQHNLTIRGVGGRAILDSQGVTVDGKGIWLLQGQQTTIAGIEFHGAAVPSENGAGIRLEGRGLTVRDCAFRWNQMGVLTGEDRESDVLIESSEFDHTLPTSGNSHNIYIGRIRSFTLQYSWSHGAAIGHLVKSRAQQTNILYNRLVDDSGGNASYEVDIPNGGTAVVLGNIIRQDPNTDNTVMVSYGAEALQSGVPHTLVVGHNTMIQDHPNGIVVQTGAAVPPASVTIANNLMVGAGKAWYVGQVAQPVPPGNIMQPSLPLLDPTNGNYRPVAATPGIDAAVPHSIQPQWIYTHPLTKQARTLVGRALDVGAYEYGLPVPAVPSALSAPVLRAALVPSPPRVDLAWTGQLSESAEPLTYRVTRDGQPLIAGVTGQRYTDSAIVYPGPRYAYTVEAHQGGAVSPLSAPVSAGGSTWDGQFASIPDNTAVLLGGYDCATRTGFSDCRKISDYSRMIYDPFLHRLLAFGGGHASTMRDDVETYDIATRTWASDYPPTPCGEMNTVTNFNGDLGIWKSSGHPIARHTYDSLVMVPNPPQLIMMRQGTNIQGLTCSYPAPGQSQYQWGKIARYDLQTKQWRFDLNTTAVGYAHGDPDGDFAAYEYDPLSGNVVIVSQYSLWIYDLDTQVRTALRQNNDAAFGYAQNLVYFPPNQKHYYMTNGGTVFEVALDRVNWYNSTVTKLVSTGDHPAARETGWAYDDVNQVIGGGIRDGVFAAYDPVTRVWTKRIIGTLPAGGVVGSMPYHTLDYSPRDNLYFFMTDVGDPSPAVTQLWAYRYKHPARTGPVFTGTTTLHIHAQ